MREIRNRIDVLSISVERERHGQEYGEAVYADYYFHFFHYKY